MKYFRGLLFILTASLMFTGCVTQKKFRNLETNYNQLKKDCQENQMQLTESRTRVLSLEERLTEARKNNDDLRASLADMKVLLDKSLTQSTEGNVNISKLVDEINASNRFIQHLVRAKNRSDSLNLLMITNLTRSLTREEM